MTYSSQILDLAGSEALLRVPRAVGIVAAAVDDLERRGDAFLAALLRSELVAGLGGSRKGAREAHVPRSSPCLGPRSAPWPLPELSRGT